MATYTECKAPKAKQRTQISFDDFEPTVLVDAVIRDTRKPQDDPDEKFVHGKTKGGVVIGCMLSELMAATKKHHASGRAKDKAPLLAIVDGKISDNAATEGDIVRINPRALIARVSGTIVSA